MAMVRCPKHKIPYNDNNPRGCPACAREKEGGRASDVMVMQELARASQMIRRPSQSQSAPALDLDKPVSKQPRFPMQRFTAAMKALRFMKQKRFLAAGGALAVLLVTILLATSGARFKEAFSPAHFIGVVRPLPVSPNDAVAVLFSAIGPQTPQPNPQARELERYSYGTDFTIEAENGRVYAITFAIPNRAWHGLKVGMDRNQAEGALALLGTPEATEPTRATADTIAGWVVYRSLDARPRMTISTAVRPPNGCFDVDVDLQPRQIGTLRLGKRSYSAVQRIGGQPIEWVVTRVRAVSRAMSGPYAGVPECLGQ